MHGEPLDLVQPADTLGVDTPTRSAQQDTGPPVTATNPHVGEQSVTLPADGRLQCVEAEIGRSSAVSVLPDDSADRQGDDGAHEGNRPSPPLEQASHRSVDHLGTRVLVKGDAGHELAQPGAALTPVAQAARSRGRQATVVLHLSVVPGLRDIHLAADFRDGRAGAVLLVRARPWAGL